MGGTIDAAPYPDPKKPPSDVVPLRGKDSLVLEVARNISQKVDGVTLPEADEERFVKDSKYITDEDIEAVADIIRKDSRRHVIITHGTDAMAKNAAAMKQLLAGAGKVVAFTGAMVPLSMDGRLGHASDGRPALRFTIDHIARQADGVYIAGIAREAGAYAFLDPGQVEKDREASSGQLRFVLEKKTEIPARRA